MPETDSTDQLALARHKAVRRAIDMSRLQTTLDELRVFASEVVTPRNEWGDGYRQAQKDLREILATLAPDPDARPAQDITAADRCGIDQAHPAHRRMLGRRIYQCPGREPAVCCACGSAEVVYRNYREQPFCEPCADGVNLPGDDEDAAACPCGHDSDRHDAQSGCIECRCRPGAPAAPDLRVRLADTVQAVIRDGAYWLPADGQAAIVAAVTTVVETAVEDERRRALPFVDRIGHAREWARRNLPTVQRHALFRVLRGDTPTLDRPEPRP